MKKPTKDELVNTLSVFVQKVLDTVSAKTGLPEDTAAILLDEKKQKTFLNTLTQHVARAVNFDRFEIIADPEHYLYKQNFSTLIRALSLRVIQERKQHPMFILKPILDVAELIETGSLSIEAFKKFVNEYGSTWDNDTGDGSSVYSFDENVLIDGVRASGASLSKECQVLLYASELSDTNLHTSEAEELARTGWSPAPLHFVVAVARASGFSFLASKHPSFNVPVDVAKKGRHRKVLKESIEFEPYIEKETVTSFLGSFHVWNQEGKIELVHSFSDEMKKQTGERGWLVYVKDETFK